MAPAPLSYFVWNIIYVSNRVSTDVPSIQNLGTIAYFVGVVVAWWYFSDLVVVGFSRDWGRWPQAAVLLYVLTLLVADLVAYGSAWGSPLGWGLFVFAEFYFGYIGISFVMAAIFAVPG